MAYTAILFMYYWLRAGRFIRNWTAWRTLSLVRIFNLGGDGDLLEFNSIYFRKKYIRSEEHTSELQSRFDLVCRLLLEKKKYVNETIMYYDKLKLSRECNH